MESILSPILSEVHRHLQSQYGERLEKVILYGSQARGDAEPGSDIDIMVVLKGNVIPSDEIDKNNDFLADLSLENDIVVSCFYISLERFLFEQSPLLINVRREGLLL